MIQIKTCDKEDTEGLLGGAGEGGILPAGGGGSREGTRTKGGGELCLEGGVKVCTQGWGWGHSKDSSG